MKRILRLCSRLTTKNFLESSRINLPRGEPIISEKSLTIPYAPYPVPFSSDGTASPTSAVSIGDDIMLQHITIGKIMYACSRFCIRRSVGERMAAINTPTSKISHLPYLSPKEPAKNCVISPRTPPTPIIRPISNSVPFKTSDMNIGV